MTALAQRWQGEAASIRERGAAYDTSAADTLERCAMELDAFAEQRVRELEAALPPGTTAGDLLIRAVGIYMAHVPGCEAETCADCDVAVNHLRLAYKVWQNSAHQAASQIVARNPDDYCTCGHRREAHHVWGRCHGTRCHCTGFVLHDDGRQVGP